jgi:hypothetical protein
LFAQDVFLHKALPTDGDHDDLEEALREVEIRDVGNLMEYLEAGDADLEELLSSVALDAEQIAAVKEKLNALKDEEQGVRRKKRVKKTQQPTPPGGPKPTDPSPRKAMAFDADRDEEDEEVAFDGGEGGDEESEDQG